MKHITIIFFILTGISQAHAQQVDLYKLTMKSDVIYFVESINRRMIAEYPNDYTANHYLMINKVDRIIKNKSDTDLSGRKIKILIEGEDYFNDAEINCGGGCMCATKIC